MSPTSFAPNMDADATAVDRGERIVVRAACPHYLHAMKLRCADPRHRRRWRTRLELSNTIASASRWCAPGFARPARLISGVGGGVRTRTYR